MNVYDFDKTVYYPDSSYHFFIYCLKTHPAAVLPVLPGGLLAALRYKTGKSDAKALKEQLFSFLPKLADVDETVRAFWRCHRSGLLSWYLEKKKDDDLIISASPEFLLKPLTDELGVRLIATNMDRHSGLISGRNCRGAEKVDRFFREYPDGHIESFYSDSLSDSPLAELADQAFLVTRGRLSPWPRKIGG